MHVLKFWHDAMPDGFTEVAYEDVVTDPETQSRRLIAAAGLDWHPACADFTQNSRTVKTLSAHQVRQPLYRSSVAAWKRHESELSEMLEILDKGR